ncbi:MAG: heat shock protein transcriptional repressor HspR [Agrococcus casei]|uniref:HspR, transcriptional repressor of DnaK operon n=1 Tax=Agrococcus casei LMG 22410 TaxID=1255656 RepID=A0A1R4GNQ0_9MICO|nr:MerR family transcriptional regulator [Agrococcus casei]SJM69744.1 HspR, transcriptional repressor of DnaK operon [Agrococcus casei LMG 22410]
MRRPNLDEIDENTPILSIAAAAELAGIHPQTLRQYDRIGLVEPGRTAGNTRRYSLRHVQQLREVQAMSAEGVSLEGIRRVLSLEDENAELRAEIRRLQDQVERHEDRQARVFAAGDQGVTSIRFGARPRKSNAVVVWRPKR